MANKVRGDTIKILRNRLGLTQQQFAERCKISDRTLKKAESGQDISDGSALKISVGLNVGISMLRESPNISPEEVVSDMVAHCMSNIYYLSHFVRNIPDMEAIIGREIEIPHTAISITCFAELLYGPFERPVYNLPLVKGGYRLEPTRL